MGKKLNSAFQTGRDLGAWRSKLRCVVCSCGLGSLPDAMRCLSCGSTYPLKDGIPVLLRENHPLFPASAYVCNNLEIGGAAQSSVRGWSRYVPDVSVNLSSRRSLERLARELKARTASVVLVVGGGRQRPTLDVQLAPHGKPAVVYADVDVSADVDLYCDAHEIPFTDQSIDAVVATAVLEHVIYPERVAAEIHRVLKVGGLLYSELPFMQQVHEGAYDFTRYTLSGHRRLFNGFRELDSGMVAGPGTALAWAIEYFLLSFVSGRAARNALKAATRLGFFWLKYFDRWLQDHPPAMDGASCTYFLGEKLVGNVPDDEIVRRYCGGQTFFKHI